MFQSSRLVKLWHDQDSLIEFNSKVGEVWYHKGEDLNALGRATEAEAAFAKAKELGVQWIVFSPRKRPRLKAGGNSGNECPPSLDYHFVAFRCSILNFIYDFVIIDFNDLILGFTPPFH